MNEAKTQMFSKEYRDLVRRSNWYVITGGPASGKTTTVDLLSAIGYKTTIEHARHYLDTKRSIGKTVEEVRKNKAAFQLGVLEMQVDRKNCFRPGMLFFLTEQSRMRMLTTVSFTFPKMQNY